MSKYVRMFVFLFFKAQTLLERSKTSVSQFGWQQIHKGKFYSRTGHEDPKREKKYNSTLSLTSGLNEVACSTPHPGHFTLGEQTCTHFTGDWVGPTCGLGGCGNFCPFVGTFEVCTFFQLHDTQRLQTLSVL